MLIAMAGLPGTGKSWLAARLAQKLGAVVLNKDEVRGVLFPPPVLDFSSRQDDVSMSAIFGAAACIRSTFPQQTLILDGRTFSWAMQVDELFHWALSVHEVPRLIECVCAEEVARKRLEIDLARGGHPAGNRSFELYQALQARAEPIRVPHLVVDTGKLSDSECVEQCLGYLAGPP
jgi:adenylylsulfate kinase